MPIPVFTESFDLFQNLPVSSIFLYNYVIQNTKYSHEMFYNLFSQGFNPTSLETDKGQNVDFTAKIVSVPNINY